MHMSNAVDGLAKIIYISTFNALKNWLFTAVLFSKHILEKARRLHIDTRAIEWKIQKKKTEDCEQSTLTENNINVLIYT